MKTLLTKGRKRSTVDVNGEKITLQELSVADAEAIRNAKDDEAGATLKMIAASVVDDEGKALYTEAELRESVGITTLKTLGKAIAELNGFDVKETPAPKASAGTSDFSSNSASPSASNTPTTSPTA